MKNVFMSFVHELKIDFFDDYAIDIPLENG